METKGTTFDLIRYEKDRGKLTEESVYYVDHRDGKTILEQTVTTRKENGKWTAKVEISEFPKLNTEDAALDKLADWLMRVSIAISRRQRKTDEVKS